MHQSFRRTFALAASLGLLMIGSAAFQPARAQFVDCESLYALRVALDGGLTNCDAAPLPVGVPDCGGMTANACSVLRDEQPRLDNGNLTGWPLANNPAGRPYVGRFLSQCVDGTDGCAGTTEVVRCMDGTRPLLYIDKAVDEDGSPIESNKWMFRTPGGGSSFRAEQIWNIYRNGSADDDDGEMSTRATSGPLWLNERFGGLYNGNRPDNAFRSYNRIMLDKCTFDRTAGDHTTSVVLDDPDFNAVTTFKADVRVFWHGMNFWVAALNFLSTTEGRDLDDDGEPDLPSITDAEVILLTPWSGGAHGLAPLADRLSDVVTTAGVDLDGDGVVDLPGLNATTAKVRVVPDGHLKPSHEVITADLLGHRLNGGVEHTYGDFFTCGSLAHPDCGAGAAATFNLPPDGIAGTDDGYGPQAYTSSHSKSFAAQGWDSMGVHLDESCVKFHDTDPLTDDDIAPCYDSVHNYLNHVETPFLIRHSLRDFAHKTSQPGGAHTRFKDTAPNFWQWGPGDHRWWSSLQFSDVFDLFATDSHQAQYATVRDPGCTLTGATSPGCWERAIFAPDQAGISSHNGIENNEQALEVRLVQCVDVDGSVLNGFEHEHRTLNTEEAVLGFVDGGNTLGPVDAIEGRTATIDGMYVTGGVAGVPLDHVWFDRCALAADFINGGCVDHVALVAAGDCP